MKWRPQKTAVSHSDSLCLRGALGKGPPHPCWLPALIRPVTNSPRYVKFEQIVEDAVQGDVNCIEASPTEQSNTKTHKNCSRQRCIRRPTKTVPTLCTHATYSNEHIYTWWHIKDGSLIILLYYFSLHYQLLVINLGRKQVLIVSPDECC